MFFFDRGRQILFLFQNVIQNISRCWQETAFIHILHSLIYRNYKPTLLCFIDKLLSFINKFNYVIDVTADINELLWDIIG